jgi:hypothetical protein
VSPAVAEPGQRPRPLPEVGFLVLGLVAYLAGRWYTLDSTDRAVANAHDILALQQTLGLDWEHRVQDATEAVPWLSAFCAHFYVWGYFPVLIATLVWLYVRHPDGYRALRNGALVSGAVGFLVQAFYPVAPPRLSDRGFTDTLTGTLDALARPLGVSNHLAAVPSFHVGWLVLAAVIVLRVTDSRALRVVWVLLPLTMSYVVVATGNHWVLDIPAGAVIAAVGLAGAAALGRRGDVFPGVEGPEDRRPWSLPQGGAS